MPVDEETGKRVQEEFTRQAGRMATAPAFREPAVLDRFVQAVQAAPSGRVLDVACGPGILAEALVAHAGEVVGIDATPEMIRLARRRFEKAGLSNGRFEVALAEALPFEAGAFDQVITRLSFHHLQDVPLALGEMRRVLRQGGQLVAADIIAADDPERAELHNALEKLRDPSHVRFFSRAGLITQIEAAGFAARATESWGQPRSFDEWAAIVDDPARTGPLERVMRALAQAGQDCGIALHDEAGRLVFTHTWLMVAAHSI